MKVTVFGEILWDVFPDGREIGGAAFNFAAHMARLGANVAFVSAVGEDSEGDDAICAAKRAGLYATAIARTKYPTGKSVVTLYDGTPDYDLPYPAAYDFITLPPEGATMRADALYLGTLPARNAQGGSRASAEMLLDKGSFGEVFFDINIRKQNYTADFVEAVLRRATVFKLSRDERAAADVGYSGDDVTAFCRAVCLKYPNIRIVLLTLDKDGAVAYRASDGALFTAPVPRVKVVSTVGGGDSLSACFLYNLLSGVPVDKCLERASILANYVVEHRGAVPEYTPELLAAVR